MDLIFPLHVAYPLTCLLTLLPSLLPRRILLPSNESRLHRAKTVYTLLWLCAMSAAANAAVVISTTVIRASLPRDTVMSLLHDAGIFTVFFLLIFRLLAVDSKARVSGQWEGLRGVPKLFVAVALVFELGTLGLDVWQAAITHKNLPLPSLDFLLSLGVPIAISALRAILLSVLLIVLLNPQHLPILLDEDSEISDSAQLQIAEQAVPAADANKAESNAQAKTARSDLGNWRRVMKLKPYLWPSSSAWLQFVAVVCVVLLLLGRLVNILTPVYLGYVINKLAAGESVWAVFAVFIILRLLQGNGGVLQVVTNYLWIPITQWSDKQMTVMAFQHLLDLSFAFHVKRKTGELLRALDRGRSINDFFRLICFQVVPILLDICVAIAFFAWKLGPLLSAVVAITMAVYVFVSIALTNWRTALRREMVQRDSVSRGIHTDALLNYETVKYFSAEDQEVGRYRASVEQFQISEYSVTSSLNGLNLVQSFILTAGLFAGCTLVAYRIVQGRAMPSDFVVFLTYLAQLSVPLNFLGSMYRSITQGLTDSEMLIDLLSEDKDIQDTPGATELAVTGGEVSFENVKFSYDGKAHALNGVSFVIPSGQSVALVGESGAGKSSILKLLFRFYDAQEGSIKIDGQDIKNVTQDSLRKAIGIVPQETSLFNETVEFNIRYAKPTATMEDIKEACKAAQIHDKIMTFADGYQTRVGERGQRLSGGEKQRIALARILLKNSRIIAFDESTSALDSHTEHEVQEALSRAMHNRSSLTIAHRLSTIAHCDRIIFLKDGKVSESGTFEELLQLDGLFAAMWQAQVAQNGAGSQKEESKPPSVHEAPEIRDDSPFELIASIQGAKQEDGHKISGEVERAPRKSVEQLSNLNRVHSDNISSPPITYLSGSSSPSLNQVEPPSLQRGISFAESQHTPSLAESKKSKRFSTQAAGQSIRKLARTLSQSGKTNKSAADIDSVDKSKSKKGKGS